MAEATGGVFCVPPMPAFVAFFLVTLPWLNPFAPGPMPSVVPLLFSWLCVAMLLGRLEIFSVLVLFTPAFWRK